MKDGLSEWFMHGVAINLYQSINESINQHLTYLSQVLSSLLYVCMYVYGSSMIEARLLLATYLTVMKICIHN